MPRRRSRRPSRTAQSVAFEMVLASHDPAAAWLATPELVDPMRACLHAVPGLTGVLYRWSERPFVIQRLRRRMERSMPGALLHFSTRKRWIDREARAACSGPGSQLVVLGAGFDSLAYRLHRQQPAIRCWEVDREGTQRIKRAALGPVGPGLRFLAADLEREPLAEVLARDPEYDPAAPTVFVAEGLLMYLREEEALGLFRSVRSQLRGGGELVGTMLHPRPDGTVGITGTPRWIDWYLWLVNEPYRYHEPSERFPEVLGRCGFEEVKVVRAPEAFRSIAGSTSADALPDLGEYFFRADAPPRGGT